MNLRHEIVAGYSKASRKKCVLSLLRNVDNDDEFLMSSGSRFQTDGAADWQAYTPITVFVRGTDNVPSLVDRSERPGTYLDIELAK